MNKNFKLLWLFLVSQPIYLSLTRKEFQGNLMVSWVYLAVKCSSEWFFKCIFWVIFLCVVYIQPWDAPQGGSSCLCPKRMDWDQKTQSGQHVPAMNQIEGAPRQKTVVSGLLALPLTGRCLCSFAGLCTSFFILAVGIEDQQPSCSSPSISARSRLLSHPASRNRLPLES